MALARPVAGLKALKTIGIRRYILSTLLSTIAMAVLVTVSFVILSPARITFSVVHCSYRHHRANGSVAITFTVATNNTSRRAAVVYESLFLDLFVLEPWKGITGNVTTQMPLLQPPRAVMNLDALVMLAEDNKPSQNDSVVTLNKTETDHFTVLVSAMVWFKVGVARTRHYDIMLSCGPADFFNPHTWPVDCA